MAEITREELLTRYKAGERDFSGLDFISAVPISLEQICEKSSLAEVRELVLFLKMLIFEAVVKSVILLTKELYVFAIVSVRMED